MKTTKMKIEYRKQVDSETAPWQLLTNMDELLWNGVYALRVAHDDGSHNLPFRFENDETVTLVVKDHAHEGMLENGRTVVQTITRVERTTGNVYVYTRTRYNAGGTHAWSYWTLAGEGNVALESPKASKSSLGSVIVGDGLVVDADGKVSLAAGAVGKKQLATGVVAKIDSMGDKLQHAASFAVNDGVALHIGALVENNTPYSGTNYRAYTDKLLSNGEHLIVNEGYSISTYKIFDGEQEISFVANLDLKQITLDGEHLNYQLEFKKDDTTAFASSELPVVIKYFQRNLIAWSAGSRIDNYIAPGTYNIKGDRTNLADGLPIYNTGSFSARLTVLAAHNCVTQVLTLLNVSGGDGNVYTRTCQHGAWGTWGKLQQNVEVGETTSLDAYIDNGIYSGVYTNGTTLFETFVMVVINNYAVAAATGTERNITQLKYAVDTNGAFSCHVRTGQGADTVEWGEWRDLDAVTTDRIQDGAVTAEKLSADVREKVEKIPSLEQSLEKEKTDLVNGDTIVGLSREVYSRQGKTDTATFLQRTTAGGTSISDGVATLKQIGGNIVKNLVDGKFNNVTYDARYISVDIADGILKSTGLQHNVYHSLAYKDTTKAEHLYYSSVLFYNYNAATVLISNSSGYNQTESYIRGEWAYLSVLSPIYQDFTSVVLRIYPEGDALPVVLFKNWLCIDLTEIFGAGKEPSKEECDRLFGTMDALPQGLTVANPTVLKSTGFNQWNPANLFMGKTVADNAIVDGDKSIAFFECLPCKVGTGENNGYVIGYGEGDDWNDAGIEVYLSPLNPLDAEGELYMHKLEKDTTTGTYVPQIKGYLLVVTPATDKLCAHFLWSGDRAKTDYEPYIESTISLPVIPQMSEWGLAGVCVDGNIVADVINLEKKAYVKRVGGIDLGTTTWTRKSSSWKCFSNEGKCIYMPSSWKNASYAFTSQNFNTSARISVAYNDGADFLTVTATKDGYASGEVYHRDSTGDTIVYMWNSSSKLLLSPTNDFSVSNIICGHYRTMSRGEGAYGATDNGVACIANGVISVIDGSLVEKTSEEVRTALLGVMLYYELAEPEEYPIVTKTAPNYVGSDYGVEQFFGCKVPLAANILFYMRSLVSETRIFLDRLMAGLGTSDVTAVADRIVAVLLPSQAIEPIVE